MLLCDKKIVQLTSEVTISAFHDTFSSILEFLYSHILYLCCIAALFMDIFQAFARKFTDKHSTKNSKHFFFRLGE